MGFDGHPIASAKFNGVSKGQYAALEKAEIPHIVAACREGVHFTQESLTLRTVLSIVPDRVCHCYVSMQGCDVLVSQEGIPFASDFHLPEDAQHPFLLSMDIAVI